MFTVEVVSCLGACGLAPAMMVNEQVHPKMTPEKAAELLKLTSLSIGDIGNAVGYQNALHFSRAFKNIYGIPPREWRNRNCLH